MASSGLIQEVSQELESLNESQKFSKKSLKMGLQPVKVKRGADKSPD